MNTWFPAPLWHDGTTPITPQSIQPPSAPMVLDQKSIRRLMSPTSPHGATVKCSYCGQHVKLSDARKGRDLYSTWFGAAHWFDKLCYKALITLDRVVPAENPY